MQDLGSLSTFIPIIAMVAVFYFFMIRPENKKKKEVTQMRDELEVGDHITTVGGMVGRIVGIKDDFVTFETGEDRVRIQVTRWAIGTKGKEATEEQQS